jgi:hypothetical protein
MKYCDKTSTICAWQQSGQCVLQTNKKRKLGVRTTFFSLHFWPSPYWQWSLFYRAIYILKKLRICMPLWKESLNNDCQQFHQYQQNEQPPLTSNHQTLSRPRHIPKENRLLTWDRLINAAGLNRLMRPFSFS